MDELEEIQDELSLTVGELKIRSKTYLKYHLLHSNCHAYSKWLNIQLRHSSDLHQLFNKTLRMNFGKD